MRELIVHCAAVVAAAIAVTGVAHAMDSGPGDHEIARQALLNKEVLPITRILAIAARRLPGEVAEVELEAKHGRLYYEVKVLTRSGRIRELLLDARTGAFIRIEDD